MDAKAVVKVGPFSRHGESRVAVHACDHDFQPEEKLTPWGIFLPALDDLFLYFTRSKVTSDFIVDTLSVWWEQQRHRFPRVKTLLLNMDNGPENNSRRTQFMKRLVEFVERHQVNIRLAYYPPYHSKYNPIERCWGILEKSWNGDLLDSVKTVIKFAENMTWKGKHPRVALLSQVYESGVKLTQKTMRDIETKIKRLPHLEKWFVDIVAPPACF